MIGILEYCSIALNCGNLSSGGYSSSWFLLGNWYWLGDPWGWAPKCIKPPLPTTTSPPPQVKPHMFWNLPLANLSKVNFNGAMFKNVDQANMRLLLGMIGILEYCSIALNCGNWSSGGYSSSWFLLGNWYWLSDPWGWFRDSHQIFQGWSYFYVHFWSSNSKG